MDFSKIPIRYRDNFSETGNPYPGDADLWSRVHEYISNKNLNSFLIHSLTCYHSTENT
jgi:hypothetical protein